MMEPWAAKKKNEHKNEIIKRNIDKQARGKVSLTYWEKWFYCGFITGCLIPKPSQNTFGWFFFPRRQGHIGVYVLKLVE